MAPQVPYDPTDVTPIHPTFTSEQHVQTSPDSFGGAVSKQIEAQQEVQNHLRASDADLAFTQQSEPLMAQYLSLQGRNAVDGQKQILQQLSDLRSNFSDNASNPMEKQILDANMNYRMGSYGREIGQHAAQQTRVWQNSTIDGQIQNTMNTGMDDYMVPSKVQDNVNRLNSLVASKADLMGWSPEEVQAQQSKYAGQYISDMIKKSADISPKTATGLLKAYGDQMDAPHQAEIGNWLDSREYTNLMKNYTAETRSQATADRTRKDNQAQNFGGLSADIMQGKPIDEGKISDMVRNQEITPEQSNALLKQNAEFTNAKPVVDKSSPRAFIDLNAGIMAGVTSADDIANAQLKEEINGRQAAILSQTLSKASQNPISESNKSQLQYLVSQVVPNTKGLSDLPDQQAQALKKYRDVSMEWTRRTVLNNEEPNAVLADMTQKYQFPARHPEEWPTPKFGPINSFDEAAQVYAKTKQAFAAGQIDQPTMLQQATIIKHYTDYYGAQPPGMKRIKTGSVNPSEPETTNGQ